MQIFQFDCHDVGGGTESSALHELTEMGGEKMYRKAVVRGVDSPAPLNTMCGGGGGTYRRARGGW